MAQNSIEMELWVISKIWELINIFTPKTVLGERIFYENENIFDKKKIKKRRLLFSWFPECNGHFGDLKIIF